ncbi:tetratricopeptide repeat protein [Pseudodesulfovibrio sediminis]|uniref:tetratricopeptide repeat protein n=1 Tax=Pseudodesulfovibrio sediminis TaxID=2810563 RepID=UPI003D318411
MKGIIYIYKDDFRRALKEFTEAINNDPENAQAYANRAFTYIALRKISEAKADAKKARELDPNVKVPNFDELIDRRYHDTVA